MVRRATSRILVATGTDRLAHSVDGFISDKEAVMPLVFLGKDPNSPDGQSPTLYYDEERGTYLFQSWKVTDP